MNQTSTSTPDFFWKKPIHHYFCNSQGKIIGKIQYDITQGYYETFYNNTLLGNFITLEYAKKYLELYNEKQLLFKNTLNKDKDRWNEDYKKAKSKIPFLPGVQQNWKSYYMINYTRLTDKELTEIAKEEEFLSFCNQEEFNDIAKHIEHIVLTRFKQQTISQEEI